MENILELWLPILVSAAFVFVASAIIWMATPLHKNDYLSPGAAEGTLMDAVRSAALKPGVYFVPWAMCDRKADEATKAAAKARMDAGPWASITISGAKPNFPMSLLLWFINLLIIGVFVAYISRLARGPTAPYLEVFQVAGSAAMLAYCGYLLPMVSWHSMPWKQLPAKLFDGVVYALITAGVFGWLWPQATTTV